jgi:hypothetical protein
MATKTKKRKIRQTKKTSVSPFMTIGPWDSFSSLVISPIILFIAYVIIFPLSIFLRKKSEKEQAQDTEVDSGKS